jgi:hypothetical protein
MACFFNKILHFPIKTGFNGNIVRIPLVMTDWTQLADAEEITKLLIHYGFDLDGHSPQPLIQHWAAHYPAFWIRWAVIEALYQGRYKVVSIEQILNIWQRRQKPIPHFNGEFERIVSSRLPKTLWEQTSTTAAAEVTSENSLSWPRWSSLAHKSGQDSDQELTDCSTAQWRTLPPGTSSLLADASVEPRTAADPIDRSSAAQVNLSFATLESASQSGSSSRSETTLSSDESPPLEDVTSLSSFHPGSLSSGKYPPCLRAATSLPASKFDPPHWSVHYPVRTSSIAQFVPASRSSGFYSRLKAVVKQHNPPPSPPQSGESAESTDLLDAT